MEIIRKGGKFSVYLYAVWVYMTKLRKREYDLIIDDINGMPWFTLVFTRKPKVAILHHLVKGIFFTELPLLHALIGYSIEACLPFVYRKTPFITVSESSKQEMVTAGIPEKHITIINNGWTTGSINRMSMQRARFLISCIWDGFAIINGWICCSGQCRLYSKRFPT